MTVKKILAAVCTISVFAAVFAPSAQASSFFYTDFKQTYESDDYSANVVYIDDFSISTSERGSIRPVVMNDFEIKNNSYSLTIPSKLEDGTEIDGLIDLTVPTKVCILSPGITLVKGKLNTSCLVAPESVRDLTEIQYADPEIRIDCYPKTYAENYAITQNLNYHIIGDLNDDKLADKKDLNTLVNNWPSLNPASDENSQFYDTNYDSKINILDVISLKETLSEPHGGNVGASTDDAESAPELRYLKRKIVKQSEVSEYTDFFENTIDDFLLNNEINKNENPVCSPASIYMAMSMAAECAHGNTQKEMLDILKASDIETLRNTNKILFNDLYLNEYNSYCQLANSLWLNSPQFDFKKDTLDIIADNYYAVSFKKDFFDINVPDEISGWINKNTSGKFTPKIIISKPETEIMDIINTITFKSSWQGEFSAAKEDIFHISDKEEIKTDFLSKVSSKDKVGFADNYMKYSLSMKNNYKMNFILPDDGVELADILCDPDLMKDITTDNLDYQVRKVYFKTPKFDVSSSFELVENFKKLGIKDAFNPYKGDFTNVVIRKKEIYREYIDKITHEATLKIDEKGCEAAAYTLIRMMQSSGINYKTEEPEPVYFYCDKPFFYYISDTEGTPVFAGIINDPSSK